MSCPQLGVTAGTHVPVRSQVAMTMVGMDGDSSRAALLTTSLACTDSGEAPGASGPLPPRPSRPSHRPVTKEAREAEHLAGVTVAAGRCWSPRRTEVGGRGELRAGPDLLLLTVSGGARTSPRQNL